MKAAISKLFLASIFAAASACATATTTGAPADTPADAANDNLNTVAFVQTAIEYKATTLALYAHAGARLDAALSDRAAAARPDLQAPGYENLPPAVVLDVDETVLDNSAYQAWAVATGNEFKGETWNAFVNTKSSIAIPGAREFTNDAANKGVAVFYVTNRDHVTEAATADNLDAEGFPLSDTEDRLMTLGEKPEWGSKKGARLAEIAKKYRIVMLVGDNFGDFSDAYKGTPAEREAAFEQARAHWGADWIVIPNPTYGSWESALFGYDYNLKPEQRRQMKIDALRKWAGE
ncbi:MAG: 5'-nucleotidase, lipoprotein e(P4) family [Parvularculaceae bacterium]|nr:5'-nucleotidase, lipoprotein e(P4) family [Parvularculaceae bacterium]